MAKKQTAHRPSQSNMEYVTTRDGRTVKNTAYSPPTKMKKAPTTGVASVLPQPSVSSDYGTWAEEHPAYAKVWSEKDMEKLRTSTSYLKRINAVHRGYRLDTLINDDNTSVRAAVAKQGYGLEQLKNDDSWEVRAEVAKQGYNLESFATDPSADVRKIVALQGQSLDVLKNDTDGEIRSIVAEQGYAHDTLKSDDSPTVRGSVARSTTDMNILKELSTDPHPYVREQVAATGHFADEYVTDSAINVRGAVATTGVKDSKLVNDPHPYVRRELAKNSRDASILEQLVDDRDDDVSTFAKLRLTQMKNSDELF